MSGLENADYVMSQVEQKRVLLRGLSGDYEVTVELIMTYNHTYSEAVAKLIVRERRLGKSAFASPQAWVTMTPPSKQPRKCFYCAKPRHMARQCRKMKAGNEKHDPRNGTKCDKCVKVRLIAEDCHRKNDKHDSEDGPVNTDIVTIAQTSMVMAASSWKSNKPMQDLCCSKHKCNNRSYFLDFGKCKRVVQIGNNGMIRSYGLETLKMNTVVDGMQHRISLREVMSTPEIMPNLISIAQARKNRLMVRADDDYSNVTRGWMDPYHKPSCKIRMCGFETREVL